MGRKKQSRVPASTLRIPSARVSQRQLRALQKAQQHVAISHHMWGITKERVSALFREYGQIPAAEAEVFRALSQQLITAEYLRTSVENDVQDDLTQHNSQFEPGALSLRSVTSDSEITGALIVQDTKSPDNQVLHYQGLPPDVAMAMKDKAGRVLWANAHYQRLLTLPVSDILGKSAPEIWNDKYGQLIYEHDREVLAKGSTPIYVESLKVGESVRTTLSVRFPLSFPEDFPRRIGEIRFDLDAAPENIAGEDSSSDRAKPRFVNPTSRRA
jgi:hypothetical protein